MKLLYISQHLNRPNIAAIMHYKVLSDIFGNDNVFAVDISMESLPKRTYHYISYGKYPSIANRIKRWLQGNCMYFEDAQIWEWCNIINKESVDYVFIETSNVGNIARKVKRKCPHVRIVTFYHDIEACLFREWRKHKKSIVDKIETTIGIRQEKLSAKFSDMNICFHQRDKDLFLRTYGNHPIETIPISSPSPEISVATKKYITSGKTGKELLFVGTNYFPNLLGIRWFVTNVFPSLEKDIHLKIVGRGLEFLSSEFTDERIHVIGYVDSLQSYYESSDIVIAPIFVGGGMKVKTIEALSYGKIFVGTKESLVGYWENIPNKVKNKVVFSEETKEGWINVINKLGRSEIRRYNEDLIYAYKKMFSYAALKEKMETLFCSK